MQRNLILVRDLRSELNAPALSDGFSCRAVSPTDPDDLAGFCAANGFPGGWVQEMLARGAMAWLAVDPAGALAAAAWAFRGPFHVEEIRRTFDAGPDADYFFGDFVAPAFRGKRLQRALINVRLRAAREANRHRAVAMTREENAASLKSYRAEGFVVAAEVRHRRWRSWELESVYRTQPHMPFGTLSQEGRRVPGVGILRAFG